MIEEHSILSKVGGIVLAAVLGGSLTTIVDNKVTNIRQEEKINNQQVQLDRLEGRLETLNAGLSEANTHLAVFNAQIKQVTDEQSDRRTDGPTARDRGDNPNRRD